MRRYVVGDQAEHTGFGLADHQHVDVQRLQRADRVQHALALYARRQLHFEVHNVGAQALGGELEATRACESKAP